MKLMSYLTTLLPTFSQDRVIEDWNANKTLLEDYVLPTYEAAADHFKTTKFKSTEAIRFDQQFHHLVRVANSHDNMIVASYKIFQQLKKHSEILEKRLENDFGTDIAKDALTYRQANLLQLHEMVGFTLNFAQLLLRFVYVAEAAKFEDSDMTLAESVQPADMDALRAGFMAYCQAMNVLGDPHTDFQVSLDSIPDAVVKAESIGAMQSTVGAKRMDPFKIGLLPPILSPIYHVRMLVAEYQSNRFHRAREEKELMQLHLAHLKRLAEGKPDAKLRQEIAYYESRVDKYSNEIADMEKKYAAHA